MKKPYSHFFFSITIIIFFFTIFTTTMQLSSAQNLINSSCKAFAGNNPNIDYAFCATSLQAAPASRCATARGLGIISIRLIRYNVTDTRCFIKQLLKNTKWEDYTKQCLGDCFDLYSDAIPAVKQAMKSFSAKRFDDANVQISSVMDASTTCEYCFGERSGGSGAGGSPLTKRNDDVFEISAVALAVMRMLQTGSAGVID